VEYLLGILHERYIVRLPRLKKDKSEMFNTSPQNLHWLWHSWATNYFSTEVHAALYKVVFPFPKVERHEGGWTRPPCEVVLRRRGNALYTAQAMSLPSISVSIL
jgi:hypothetical protein